jgi:hypothetical protein
MPGPVTRWPTALAFAGRVSRFSSTALPALIPVRALSASGLDAPGAGYWDAAGSYLALGHHPAPLAAPPAEIAGP